MRIVGTVLIAAGIAGWLLSMPTASTAPSLPQGAPITAPQGGSGSIQPAEAGASGSIRPAAPEAAASASDAAAVADGQGVDTEDWSEEDEE
jgi:hypothetical protein